MSHNAPDKQFAMAGARNGACAVISVCSGSYHRAVPNSPKPFVGHAAGGSARSNISKNIASHGTHRSKFRLSYIRSLHIVFLVV